MRGTSTTTGGSALTEIPARVWSTVLTGTVLVVYVCMVSANAMPGRSADLIVKALGLEPRLSPSASLWFALTHPLTLLPQAVLALNLFSTLCAVICVWLVGWILREVVLMWADEKMLSQEQGQRLTLLASLSGSAALAFSPPFWAAALRADTGTFDAALVLLWFFLCLRFVQTLRLSWAYAAMVLAGMGATQSVAFFWLAPLALVSLFGLLAREARHRVRVMVKLLFSLVLPYLVITTLQSWHYMGSEGHRLTGSLPLLQVALELGWGQLLVMRRGVSTEGWLLGFLVIIAPWLACTGLMARPARKNTPQERNVSADRPALHTMATVATLGVFLDAPFSLWAIYGEQTSWLTPVVLSALTFGWLAAYWYRFAMTLPAWCLWKKPAVMLPVRHVALALTLLVLGKGVLSNSPSDARLMSSVISAYAERLVDAVDTRHWLLTGSSIDSAILIEAHKRELPLQVLNMTRMPDRLYRDYMAGKFTDPQLANACRIGMNPLVSEWFGNATNLDQVAVLSLPDLYYAAGLQPQPNVLVFFGSGRSGAKPVSPEKVWELNMKGWAALEPLLEKHHGDPARVAAFRAHARHHLSFVANNTGVWLEDQGRPALAGLAYEQARRYEPYNVSALLNIGALVRQGVVTRGGAAILNELKTLVDAKPKLHWWSLTRRYGYVRQAEAYAALGHAWALSGQPGITAAGLSRSAELATDETSRDQKESVLALLYSSEGQLEESRKIYERQLVARPDDVQVLIGLARLALATNDTAAACAWLKRAEKPGQLKEGVDLVVAGLYSQAGDLGRARVLTQAAIDRTYDNLPAWTLLAGVALGQGDAKTLDLCRREIHRLEKGRHFNSILIEALHAMDKGEMPLARTLFEEALHLRAKSVETMERILRLDLLLGPREKTADMARFLILIDSRNALAHYILGVLQIQAKAWAEARPWLEKSVSLSPAPEALNDLAWVLLQQKDLTLAEQHARAAVTRHPRFGSAWDTLGMILIEAGRYDEAVDALEGALKLSKGRPPVLLAHLALARFGQGDKPEAILLLQEAVSGKRALTPQEDAEIRAARQRIKIARQGDVTAE